MDMIYLQIVKGKNKMKQGPINSYVFAILVIVLGLLWYFNLTTPLWGNMLLAFGAFNQAEYHWAFPDTIFYADYIRGGFYKFLLYFIYKFVGLFTTIENYSLFQYLTKIIYYIITVLFTYFSLFIGKPNQSNKDRLLTLMFFWVIVLIGGYRQFMESEELAAILVFCHVMFIISPKKWANYLSGVFVYFLFGCKAVTILYVAFGPLYFLFLSYDKEKLFLLIKSHLFFLGLTIFSYLTFLKPELDVILRAMALQDSAKFNGLKSIMSFIHSYIKFYHYQPLHLTLPFILVYSFVKDKKVFFLLLLGILVSSMAVIIQNRFSSPYHFLSFLPVFILGMMYIGQKNNWIAMIILVIPIVLTIRLNTTIDPSRPKVSNLYYKQYFLVQAENAKAMNLAMNNLAPNPNDQLLFLTGDCPPYFFKRPNANKMVGAIFLNRSMFRKSMKDPKYQLELEEFKNGISNFDGKFILFDPEYLPIDSFPVIKNKLNNFDTLYIANNQYEELGEAKLILFKNK
jgi:hypothetical protein